MEDKESFVDRLDAYVKANDVDYDDLGIVVEEEYQETQDEIASLKQENERLESEMEDLQEEVDAAKEAYAEDLADFSLLSAEELAAERPLSDLRERHEALQEEGEVDALGGTPAPVSGDVGGEEASTPDPEEMDMDRKRELARFMSPGNELDELGFDWQNADRERFIEELQARRDHMAAMGASSPIKQAAVEEYDELLAELTGEE